MKKSCIIIIVSIMLMSFMTTGYVGEIHGTRIQMSIVKDHGLNDDFPRDLIEIPTVSIEGDCLYFYDVFSVTVPLVVVDSNNNVVFSAYLYSGEDKKLLPDSLLSGTYTLYMRVGTTFYYGTFNL